MLRVVIHGGLDQRAQTACAAHLGRSLPLESGALPAVEACFSATEGELLANINQRPAHVFVSIGPRPKPLVMLPLVDRRRWLHFDQAPRPDELLRAVHETYLSWAVFAPTAGHDEPLVSVYTPTFNPGQRLMEAYASLCGQGYRNWEWVLVDDGSSDGTPRLIERLARADHRIKAFFPQRRGQANIGWIKRQATGLCEGEILVELDHDDMLGADCLQEVVAAFAADPELGMVHSNFAEFLPDGSPHVYPEWEDRGRYRWTELQGRRYREALAYDVYGDVFGAGPVIQHMAVCPNHVRAFRASELWRLGGYNPRLVIADDYELMIRFFVGGKIGHIAKLLYLYRVQDNTWSRFNDLAKWLFNVIERRWRGPIEARVAELKAQGRWNPAPQGVLPAGHPALERAARVNRQRGVVWQEV